jgi:putative ABC transport system permease protein
MPRLTLTSSLAFADLNADRGVFWGAVVAVAAILAPLVMLFGLKAGLIDGLRGDFIANPRAREILNLQSLSLRQDFFDSLRARPEVAFAIPRVRTLSASGTLAAEAAPDRSTRVEITATDAGDPLLPGVGRLAADEVVLSQPLAQRLELAAGAAVVLRSDRVQEGSRQSMLLPLRVRAVAPLGALGREGVWLDLPTLLVLEDFLDGLHGADARIPATPPEARVYAGFRLYARTLADVPVLDLALRRAGIDVFTRAEDITALEGLDRDLTRLFALAAGLAGGGCLVALGTTLLAAVQRKRRSLALLRLAGLSTAEMTLFPLVQAGAIGLAGGTLAAGAALGAQAVANRILSGVNDRLVSDISPAVLAVAVAATVVAAALAASVAGWRAGRIEPAEAMHG